MANKTELTRLAAELKALADRLLDLCKENDKEEDNEDTYGDKPKHAMLGLMLSKKMGKK